MKKKNLGDWAVALVVVACGVILFLALTFALTGTFLGRPNRTVRANFHDATGINLSANVKYAGARAGEVVGIRMLTADERRASGDPGNLVQVTLALHKSVPDLPADIEVSIAADTLLSDKFVLLSGGSLTAPPLAQDATVQGVTPVTFDTLVRNFNRTVNALNGVLGGQGDVKGEIGGLVGQLRIALQGIDGLVGDLKPTVTDARSLVGDAGSLITEARSLVSNGNVLARDAGDLVTTNRDPITRAVRGLEQTATSFDRLAGRANSLLATNDARLNATLKDIRAVSENLKVTSTYAIILTKNLARRPQQLLWGGRPPALPTRQEIQQSAVPLPAN